MPLCNYLKVEADKNLGNLATFRHYGHAQSVKYDMPALVSDLASARGPRGTMTIQGSRIVNITEKHARKYAQSTTFGLFIEASLFRLTSWFLLHLFLFIFKHLPARDDI